MRGRGAFQERAGCANFIGGFLPPRASLRASLRAYGACRETGDGVPCRAFAVPRPPAFRGPRRAARQARKPKRSGRPRAERRAERAPSARNPPNRQTSLSSLAHSKSQPTKPTNQTNQTNQQATTLPLDTAKVKLQLQKGGESKYRGLLGTCATVAREEGVSALYKGLEPGLHRQVINGGLRIGLYDPVKQIIVGKDHVGDVPLWGKIGAGLATGAIAITVASPTDLVKVRMQGEGKLPPGVPRRYSSATAAYGIIAREEGLTGLWKGLGPNVARNAIINAAELASYDQIKQSLLASGYFTDNVVTHLVAGLGAGFFAVCVGSPVDVVKSRVMGEFLCVFLVSCASQRRQTTNNKRQITRVHTFRPATKTWGRGTQAHAFFAAPHNFSLTKMGRSVSHHARRTCFLKGRPPKESGAAKVRTVAHPLFSSL